MRSLKYLTTGSVALLLAAPAMGQTVGQVGQRQDTPVRIQTGLNFFVAGPAGDSEEAQKARENARRSIYETAAKECDLLREVIAKDCHLQQVSINIGRQFGPQQQEGFTVNASMSFQITLK